MRAQASPHRGGKDGKGRQGASRRRVSTGEGGKRTEGEPKADSEGDCTAFRETRCTRRLG